MRFSTSPFISRSAAAWTSLSSVTTALADARHFLQPLGAGADDLGEGAEACDERLGQRLRVLARDGAEQERARAVRSREARRRRLRGSVRAGARDGPDDAALRRRRQSPFGTAQACADGG